MPFETTTTVHGLHYKYDCDDSHYIFATPQECEAQILQIVSEYRHDYEVPGEMSLADAAEHWVELTNYREDFYNFTGEIPVKALTGPEQILLEEVLQSVLKLFEKRGSPDKIRRMRTLTQAITSAEAIILE